MGSVSDSFGTKEGDSDLLVSISNHIAYPPALILKEVAQGCQQHAVTGLLLLGNLFRDRNQDVHSQQTHAVLIIAGQILKEGYHFVDDHRSLHLLHELRQVVGGLTANHRGFIVYEGSEVLSEALLQRWRGFSVW